MNLKVTELAWPRRPGAAAGTAGVTAGVRGAKAVTEVKAVVAPTVHAPTVSAAAIPALALRSTGTAKRVLKEYTALMKDAPTHWRAWVNEANLMEWKVIFNGPPGTPYEDGNFLLTVSFPSNFPFQAPKVRFVTPIYHCNMSMDGRICIDILKDSWSPAITMHKLFLAIESLVLSPNPNDPMDAYKATLLKDDKPAYQAEARAATLRAAARSVEEMISLYSLEE